MVGGRLSERVAIGLDLIGDGVIVTDVADGLLVDLAGEGSHIGSAQGLRWLPERFEEGIEGIDREGKAFPDDLRFLGPQREEDLVADDDAVLLAGNGKADALPLWQGRERPAAPSR